MSGIGTTTRIGQELRSICGAEHVVEDPALLQASAILGVVPTVAVWPASADEIAAIVRFANEHRLSVVPAGGFTHQQTGNAPLPIDVLLHTIRLKAVEHYDPGDLTIGVGAGWSVADLTSKVGSDGLLFAGDPALPERATIGGLLATGMTGPLRHGYGGLRDYCIGIKFVTGDGRKAKGGGRVVKNVAGYDLMKLLIGSQGALAIITGASFKLFPAPRQTRTFIADFQTADDALKFRDAVLHSPLSPICMELVSPGAHAQLTGQSEAWSLCVRAAGSNAALGRYRTELGSAVSTEIEDQGERDLWRALSDFSHTFADRHSDAVLITFALPLSKVRSVLKGLAGVAEGNGLKLAAIGRVGIGHLLAGLGQGTGAVTAGLINAVSMLREQLPRDCSMAILQAPPQVRHKITAWVATPTHLGSMRAVKQALDRNDILNRGRFPL